MEKKWITYDAESKQLTVKPDEDDDSILGQRYITIILDNQTEQTKYLISIEIVKPKASQGGKPNTETNPETDTDDKTVLNTDWTFKEKAIQRLKEARQSN